jgi:hypothetical protein
MKSPSLCRSCRHPIVIGERSRARADANANARTPLAAGLFRSNSGPAKSRGIAIMPGPAENAAKELDGQDL